MGLRQGATENPAAACVAHPEPGVAAKPNSPGCGVSPAFKHRGSCDRCAYYITIDASNS